MLDLTLLTKEQVKEFSPVLDEEDNQLDILKKYGKACGVTDFSHLLGCYVTEMFYTSEGKGLKDRTGMYFTKTFEQEGINDYYVYIIGEAGNLRRNEAFRDYEGLRPVLPYSSISSFSINEMIGESGIKEIEYGEYPQWIVDKDSFLEIEEEYKNGRLATTGKNYTVYLDYTKSRLETYNEYEYNGKKYIRFISGMNTDLMSDGRRISQGEPVWVKVEPIKWLVDEKTGIALSKYIILSGIPFDDNKNPKNSFEETFIKKFMDTYLAKEIEWSVRKVELIENNSFDFDSIFEDAIKKMNEINNQEEVKKLTKRITN